MHSLCVSPRQISFALSHPYRPRLKTPDLNRRYIRTWRCLLMFLTAKKFSEKIHLKERLHFQFCQILVSLFASRDAMEEFFCGKIQCGNDPGLCYLQMALWQSTPVAKNCIIPKGRDRSQHGDQVCTQGPQKLLTHLLRFTDI